MTFRRAIGLGIKIGVGTAVCEVAYHTVLALLKTTIKVGLKLDKEEVKNDDGRKAD
jgi:hypothetical protein